MSAPRIGVIGAGQLARMMQPCAIDLGINLRVLCNSPEESAAQVIPDKVVASHSDIEAVLDFARDCDVITFDHEHVPSEVLQALVAAGHNLQPNPSALQFAQDKLMMRAALTEAGIACPKWAHISSEQQLEDFALQVGWPLVLKSAKGGYDGKGVWVVDTQGQAAAVIADIQAHGQEVLAEERVPFVREIAAQVARSPHGQCVAYPIVQSTQTDGICHEVIAPCPDLTEQRTAKAQEMALKIAAMLDVTGMLAVEIFDTGTQFLVNELAMRPHNSGHWTMNGAVTSQFENHLRAVLDWPLGSPAMVAPHAVMVNLLGKDLDNLHSAFRHVMARDPGIKVHLYGKTVKPGRKIGHVNALGDNLEDLKQRAWHAADYLTGVIDE